MRSSRRVVVTSLCLFLFSLPTRPQSQGPVSATTIHGPETLTYGVEWRLIRAGTVKMSWQPGNASRHNQAEVILQSAGIVAKLYKVDDHYTVHSNPSLCSTDIFFTALEGKRQRETRVTFDSARSKAFYLEKDVLKNATASREVDTPKCVHDVINGLFRLRGMKLDPGQSMQMPISDGKKMVYARIEAQEREQVKTPTGTYNTIRYEVFLFNDVLYSKKGKLFLLVSDDARRLPVQIRARLQFPIGTITFSLEKIE